MRVRTIGNMRIERVVEIERMLVAPDFLYRNIDREAVQRHKASLGPVLVDSESDKLAISFHSFVIRTPHRTILVDTCNGNHKDRPTAPWQHRLASDDYLMNLRRIGLRPEDIDVVLCTHLHTDHVGWNTRLRDGRWVPTFPKARYVIARQEFEHYARLHATRPVRPVGHGSFEDSVLPVVAAGQADFVDMHHVVERHLDDHVWMDPAPGHSPGHVTIHVSGRDGHAIMSGDIIHHPIILAEPHLINPGDLDPVMARQARQRLLEACADTDTLLLTGHFPAPTAGRVVSRADGFRFQFAD